MEASARVQADPWNETALASAEDTSVRELARLLELRGQGEDQVAIRAAYLDLLGIAPGERVLDVGCGTGVVTRAVAQRVGSTGRVVGLDPSPVMLAVGREQAEREGLLDRVAFQPGDMRALPFDAATFDTVLAITALSHATDGEQAVAEMVRVVRPGGQVGVLDIDADSWIVSHPDRELTRRVVVGAADAIVNGGLARRLPGLFTEAGLMDVRVRAFTPIEQDPASYYARNAELRVNMAVRIGAVSEEERERWLAGLRTELAEGRFLAGVTHLFIWARRPV